jgi:hypothetical protein
MCIALASTHEAHRLADLVNLGPQQARTATSGTTEPTEVRSPSHASRAEPPKPVPHTTAPAERSAQNPSGSTQSAAERAQAYSSHGSAGRARADPTGDQGSAAGPAVFIHVRSLEQRAHVERLIEPLSARGIRVTGIKLMDAGPQSTDLRYFHPDDARQTDKVVSALRSVGLPLPRIKHIRGFENRATPRQYELWLSSTDRPNEISAERTRTRASKRSM